MIQYLVAVIIIIIGLVCDCIWPNNCRNAITGGAAGPSDSLYDQTLKIVMPPKLKDGSTFLQVLQQETNAIKTNVPFSLTLDADASQLPYRQRPFELKGVVHWGQLKLMLSEIQFLSEHGHLSNTVVYAGSAPGTHIKLLSSMFPKHKFILWDPRPFNVTGKMIEIHEEYFTDEVAQQYAGQNCLFVSDIRTGNHNDSTTVFEEHVKTDMNWQMNWHKIIMPIMGMYKFRLPYVSGKTKYMAGVLQMQIFAPTSTTELRLIVPQQMETMVYDNDVIEQQMYHFNYFVRPKWYNQHLRCCSLDGCWDCTAFVKVVKMYMKSAKKNKFPNSKAKDIVIKRYVLNIIKSCSSVNKLDTPPHADGSNVGWFKRMHKYENSVIDSNKHGNSKHFEFEMGGTYKKIVSEIKEKDPSIITSPIINFIKIKPAKKNKTTINKN
jgi:hypothetical protein